MPSLDFIEQVSCFGYSIPEFVQFKAQVDGLVVDDTWEQRKFKSLEPWGWNEKAARLLEPLRHQLIHSSTPLSHRCESYRQLSSKAWLADNLNDILKTIPEKWRKAFTTHRPMVLKTVDEVVEYRDRLYELGYDAIVVKAPFGTAGGRAQRLLNGEEQSRKMSWVDGVISRQHHIVVEPWYHRLADLSYQFSVQSDGQTTYHGLTQFFTDISGRYRGTFLGPLGRGLPEVARRLVFQATDTNDWLLKILPSSR